MPICLDNLPSTALSEIFSALEDVQITQSIAHLVARFCDDILECKRLKTNSAVYIVQHFDPSIDGENLGRLIGPYGCSWYEVFDGFLALGSPNQYVSSFLLTRADDAQIAYACQKIATKHPATIPLFFQYFHDQDPWLKHLDMLFDHVESHAGKEALDRLCQIQVVASHMVQWACRKHLTDVVRRIVCRWGLPANFGDVAVLPILEKNIDILQVFDEHCNDVPDHQLIACWHIGNSDAHPLTQAQMQVVMTQLIKDSLCTLADTFLEKWLCISGVKLTNIVDMPHDLKAFMFLWAIQRPDTMDWLSETLFHDDSSTRIRPNEFCSLAMQLAAAKNNVFVAKMLLNDTRPDRCHPDEHNSWALDTAVRHGHYEIVQCLLEHDGPHRVVPSYLDGKVLVTAVMSQHFDVFKLLMEDRGSNHARPSSMCIQQCVVIASLEEGDDRFLKYVLQDKCVQASHLVAARKLAVRVGALKSLELLDTRL